MPRKTYSHFLQLYRQGLVETDLKSIHEASAHLVILCLSAVNDSIPMWSHYAGHHKGIVIGLDPSDTCFTFGLPLARVRYRTRRVSVNPIAPGTPQALWNKTAAVLLTKSRAWQYEKEYRLCYRKPDVISKTTGTGATISLIHIWPKVIREVILGCSISHSFESAVRQILAMPRFAHVRLLRAHRHATEFRLDIVPA